MGDPKKLRKTYSTPNHPWQKARIDEEKELMKTYGMANKKEVWKMFSILKTFHSEAKRLVALRSKQAQIEKENLLKKLNSLNLVGEDADTHEILSITIKNILDRRLQTILVKKSLARSIKQSRQLITHGHVLIENKKITSPSYLVTEEELNKISFREKSPFNNPEHPERVTVEKVENEEDKRPSKE